MLNCSRRCFSRCDQWPPTSGDGDAVVALRTMKLLRVRLSFFLSQFPLLPDFSDFFRPNNRRQKNQARNEILRIFLDFRHPSGEPRTPISWGTPKTYPLPLGATRKICKKVTRTLF